MIPDVVVVLSREELQAYRSILPGQQVVLIPNAVDASELVTRQLDQQYEGELRIAYIGRLVEQKGVFVALEAIAAALSDGCKLRMTFVGEGPDESRLIDRVRSLGLQTRVHSGRKWMCSSS